MYYLLLGLSLAIHIALYFSLKYGGELHYKNVGLEELIENISRRHEDPKQIIIFAEAPDVDVTSQEKTKLLSKKQQRVKKQSIAKKVGRTENRRPLAQVNLQKKQPDRSGIGQMVKPKAIDINRIGSIYQKSGISTIGEKIFDNIDLGNFTALNTDEYSFYSFSERVNDRIRSRWINSIETSLIGLKRRGLLKSIKTGESRTIIEVLLDKKGYYKGTKIFKSSGLKAWDQAAIAAFEDGAPFLNPPHEIVEEDGFIRLRYSFSVMWHPSYARLIR